MKVRKFLAMFLMASLVATSIPTTTYAKEMEASVEVPNADSRIFKTSDYQVEFNLDSSWVGGYNMSVEIKNTGDRDIENWYLQASSNDRICNIWNAEISNTDENSITFKNVGFNQDIRVGESVCFGYYVDSDYTTFPENARLLNGSRENSSENSDFVYSVQNDWGTGFMAK